MQRTKRKNMDINPPLAKKKRRKMGAIRTYKAAHDLEENLGTGEARKTYKQDLVKRN